MPEAKSKSAATRGRQPDANSKSGKIRALLSTGMSVADIAKKVGCSANLVYNVKARMGGSKRRGPGRPPKAKAAPTAALDGIEGIVAAVKAAEQQRNRLRSALERIQELVDATLA